MGIFDFLKKILEDKKSETVEIEKVTWSEVEKWIEIKKKEIEEKEGKIFIIIKNKINTLTNDLESKINVVKGFNVHEKKVEDRLKSAAEDGRKKYIEAVSSLIKNLNSLEEGKAEIVIAKIDKFFLDFSKNSHMSYERATILIGKEMADLKNEIKTFSRDMIDILNENKYIVDFSRAMPAIEAKLKQVDEIKKDEERINEKSNDLYKEINEKQEENKRILKEIDKIKESPEHLEHLKNIEECKLIKESLEKDFISLIQLINFKALTSFYHIFEKENERVKDYKNEFRITFQKDNGEELLGLLNTAKLNNENISNKINEINLKADKLKDLIGSDKDKTEELHLKTETIITNIDNLKNMKIREEKRLEKIKITKEEIAKEIKKDFERLKVDLN